VTILQERVRNALTDVSPEVSESIAQLMNNIVVREPPPRQLILDDILITYCDSAFLNRAFPESGENSKTHGIHRGIVSLGLGILREYPLSDFWL
jgi:hypothetical protein